MKKSIKYAGIAAATLLAVAPVAAPVVSSTTNVQAATNATTEQSVQTKSVNAFMGQFDSSDDVLASTLVGKTITPESNVSLSKFVTDNDGLIVTPYADDATSTQEQDIKNINSKQDATISVTAKSGSQTLTNPNDVQKYLKDDTKSEVDFTITMTWYDLLGNEKTSTKTVKAVRDSEDENQLTQLNASFTTPITVPLNSTTTDTQLTGTTGIKLTDQNGDGVFDGTIAVGASYYSTFAQAMDNAAADTAANAESKTDSSIVNSDNEFIKAGTYYQAITFTASNANSTLSQFIGQYKTNPSKYAVYVNGAVAAPGYDFNSTAAVAGTPAEGDTPATEGTPATITFVRSIKVTNDTSDWTVTANKGVVTTKSDNAYYTLKNDDNQTITNRALAKNTAWVTDQKRVDQDGNTQYRVATGEWIDANDVTFSDKATTDEGEYTDVQALNGKVTLDGPSSFIYMLYNDNGETVSNRALAGDSAWYTDKKATNAAGVTVYHVATGEWVQAGSGVNYVAY